MSRNEIFPRCSVTAQCSEACLAQFERAFNKIRTVPTASRYDKYWWSYEQKAECQKFAAPKFVRSNRHFCNGFTHRSNLHIYRAPTSGKFTPVLVFRISKNSQRTGFPKFVTQCSMRFRKPKNHRNGHNSLNFHRRPIILRFFDTA